MSVSGRPRALYLRIADKIRSEISDGSLAPGGKLPTEAELTEEWETSRATVVKALQQLVHKGLIVPDRPRGYFVRQWRPMVYRPQGEFRRKPPEVDIFTHLVASEDGRTPTQAIEVSIVSPPKIVRDRLNITTEDLVAIRRRTRLLDDQPYNLNDSYVALSLVEGTEWMTPGDVARGTNQVLAELGRELIQALDEIYTRMPTPEEERRLELGPGTPVAEHVVTNYTADGQPVQVTINVLPGDRHVIVFERRKSIEDADQPRLPWGAQ